jgi:DNA-binding PadR family transcriptional regulator
VSTIRLLVLGAVKQHGRAHGYQVRSDLESWGAHEWSTARAGSIYHALRQLATHGLLLAHQVAPSTAGGPPRTEYEITQRGTEEFHSLLRQALVSYDQKLDVISAGVGFIVHLPREEVLALLRRRVEGLGAWRTSVTDSYDPDEGPGPLGHIGEVLHLWVHSAEAGAQWTRGLIERIEGGAYTFQGEEGHAGS